MNTQNNGTLPTWDLSVLYSGPNDPQIDTDTSTFVKLAKDFYNAYHGNVATCLEQALRDFLALYSYGEKGIWYLENLQNLDLQNHEAKKKRDEIHTKIAAEKATCAAFFGNEIAEMGIETITALATDSPLIAQHIPYFKAIINKHNKSRSPQIETALATREHIGPSAWTSLYCEQMARFTYPLNHKILKKHEIIDILNNQPSSAMRARALYVLNCTLSGCFRTFTARAMSITAENNRIENAEKNQSHVASERFTNDQISQATFDALHQACLETVVPLAKKYYAMKSVILDEAPLRWSSRRGPIECYETILTYETATKIILDAFHNFDPSFSEIVQQCIEKKWIDAAPRDNKAQTTYSASRILHDKFVGLVFMIWENTINKTQYLGHELGHLIHFALSAKQGPLLEDPGNALGEIASLFCELLTSEALEKKFQEKTRTEKSVLLRFLMEITEDTLDDLVQQICFSSVELRIHNAKTQLSADEIEHIWVTEHYKYYGKEGETFTFKDTHNLWTTMHLFFQKFYTHNYASGRLIASALFQESKRDKEQFKKRYLNMLADGGTKNLKEALAPFDFDPENKQFWSTTIKNTLEPLIAKTEAAAREVGYL